jgi:hypothetical protein
MPNTPVPATGEAMPAAKINRRLMLSGLAAVSTAAAVPAAQALEPTENPHLVKLGDQLSAAAAKVEEARDAREWLVAEWRHLWPLAPDAITLPWGREVERGLDGSPLVRPGEENARSVRSEKTLSQFVEYAERDLGRVLSRKNATEKRIQRARKYVARMQEEYQLGRDYWAETKRAPQESRPRILGCKMPNSKSFNSLTTSCGRRPELSSA